MEEPSEGSDDGQSGTEEPESEISEEEQPHTEKPDAEKTAQSNTHVSKRIHLIPINPIPIHPIFRLTKQMDMTGWGTVWTCRHTATVWVLAEETRPSDAADYDVTDYAFPYLPAALYDRDLFGVVSKDEQPTPEPTATPTPKPTAEPKPEAEKTSDSTAMMVLVLLVMLIAGGAAAFVVLRKKRDAQPRYNTELDDDDDEEEIGEDNEEE